MPQYTPAELMVVAAAREIRDHEVVFVGMRLPLLSFQLANATHAPHATSVFEIGAVRDTPASEMIYTMGDLPVAHGAEWLTDLGDAMALLQQGLVDLSFIGGAEIDRFGNLNTTCIGPATHPTVRLPGSGGACDLAEVQAATGWDLRVAADLHETPEPTEAELRLLRQFDPQGFWTGA
jgi:glutaconate CoA-transferase subunit B